MRKKLCLLVLAASVATFVLPQTAAAAKTARILVHFDRHTGVARQKALLDRIGGRREATVHSLRTAIVRVPVAEKKQALTLLRRQADVSYAEADGFVHAFSTSINDPYSIAPYAPWPLANPLFPEAWDLTTGDASVVVAVVDSGVQADHPELMGRVLSGYDFVNGDSDPADDFGHGTEVAGVIAAQGNNGIGIAGVCWKCEIMPVKVLDSSGAGTDSWVSSGITWAVDHGADVINLSLGGTNTSQTLANAVSYAETHGVVVVAAAGNDGVSTLNYPAAYDGVISVGAVDEGHSRYTWSNYGSWVMVDAPGCTNSTSLGSTYTGFCGTSAATPFVAGLAGLARSYSSSASSSSVVSAIEQSAQNLASGNSIHGLIDAECTLQAITSVSTCLVASFTASATSGTTPLTVSFSNTSINASSYSWSFGDGTSSTDSSPTHTFTAVGSYNVTLVAGNGARSRLANATITVTAPAPVAVFAMSASSGRAPLNVSFTNTSTDASYYGWSFGDGSSSSIEISPTHTYTKAGTYAVTLTATGAGGSATASKTFTISPPLPDLALSLVRKASKLKNGYRLSSFVASLRNRGGTADSGVKITITLPSGSSFRSVSSGGRKCARTQRRATCSLGTIEAGKSLKLSFVARVTKRANVKASVSGAAAEISLANNMAQAKTR
ncbi:MAG TPA: S8 family serine peptidase [Gaiellaceae bacterium]|jgi:subtilisin family serine protease